MSKRLGNSMTIFVSALINPTLGPNQTLKSFAISCRVPSGFTTVVANVAGLSSILVPELSKLSCSGCFC